jgi:hypothetical protein
VPETPEDLSGGNALARCYAGGFAGTLAGVPSRVRLGVLGCFEAGAGRKVSERQIVVSLTRKPRDHMHVWLWPACMPDPPRHVSADRFETPGLST